MLGNMIEINKNEKGITLIVLVITIIVMFIIASITVYQGKEIIIDAKLDTAETNLLTIEAKAKGYAEEIDAMTWNLDEDKKEEERDAKFKDYGMTPTTISSNYNINSQINKENAYTVTAEALQNMGLSDLAEKNEEFIVVYDYDDYKIMDVIYTKGVSDNNNTYYTLSELQEILGN
jgi:Tfp pilus assembly protein PilE